MSCFNCFVPSCVSKPSGEAADTLNLPQKVHLEPAVPEAAPPAEDENVLPEWSEKVAHGILTGETRARTVLCNGKKENVRSLLGDLFLTS